MTTTTIPTINKLVNSLLSDPPKTESFGMKYLKMVGIRWTQFLLSEMPSLKEGRFSFGSLLQPHFFECQQFSNMSRPAPKTFWDTLPPNHKPGQPPLQASPEPFDFADHSLAEIDEWFGKKIDPHGAIRKREELAARVAERHKDPNYKPRTGAMYPPTGPHFQRTARKSLQTCSNKVAPAKKGRKTLLDSPHHGCYQPAGYPKGLVDDGNFKLCSAADGGCNLKPCLVHEQKMNLTCHASKCFEDGFNLLPTYSRLKAYMYKRYCKLLSNRFLKKDIDSKLPQCCIRQCKIALKMCMNDRPKWMWSRGPTIDEINAMDLPPPAESSGEDTDSEEDSLADAPQLPARATIHTAVVARPNRVSLDSQKSMPQKRGGFQLQTDSSDSSDDDEPVVLSSQYARKDDSDSSDDSCFHLQPSPPSKRRRIERGFRLLEECFLMSQSRIASNMVFPSTKKVDVEGNTLLESSSEDEFEFLG